MLGGIDISPYLCHRFNFIGYDRLRVHFTAGEVVPFQGMGVGRIEEVCGYAAQTYEAGVDIALLQQMGERGQGF